MSAEPDVRCPYCNGTGGLPKEAVERFEAERDQRGLRAFKLSQCWGEVADLLHESKKKSATLESLQRHIRSAYDRCGALLTLTDISGRGA